MERNHRRDLEASRERAWLEPNRGYDAYDRSDYGYAISEGFVDESAHVVLVLGMVAPSVPEPARMPNLWTRGDAAELDGPTVDAFSPP